MKDAVLIAILVAMFLLVGCTGCGGGGGGGKATPILLTATSKTTATLCAEEDNVNVPITGTATSFLIEATHPISGSASGGCQPDFTNCPPSQDVDYPFTAGVFKLFDNGVTVFEAVCEAKWWRPNGMTVTVNGGQTKKEIHYIRFAAKISGEASWPQYLVLYMDGNMRLKPQPPIGSSDTCFGSSVIVGPAAVAKRPLAEIDSVNYVSVTGMLEISYRDGSSATLKVATLDRTRAGVQITFNGPTALPLITFRSMYVDVGNADVDHLTWKDSGGAERNDPIMTFVSGQSAEWFFHRTTRSRHNTSSPDIKVKSQ